MLQWHRALLWVALYFLKEKWIPVNRYRRECQFYTWPLNPVINQWCCLCLHQVTRLFQLKWYSQIPELPKFYKVLGCNKWFFFKSSSRNLLLKIKFFWDVIVGNQGYTKNMPWVLGLKIYYMIGNSYIIFLTRLIYPSKGIVLLIPNRPTKINLTQ